MQQSMACSRVLGTLAAGPKQAAQQQRSRSAVPVAAAAAHPQRCGSRLACRPPPSVSAIGSGGVSCRAAADIATSATGRYEAPTSAAGNVVVQVCPDEAAVANFLCEVVEASAAAAIAKRGVFTLAIPGGSVLKALAGLAGRSSIPWDKVRIFWVNHKAVPNEDAATSSYAKARALFLDAVKAPPGCVATLTGSDDAEAEAAAYAAALAAAADEASMARAPSGAPRFDLMLLGVGADGHVGSLYPGGAATLADPAGSWVLPVVKDKPPSSITLSLGVMNAAHSVVVCLTGAKKAAAAKLALETLVPAGDFPAQLVQPDSASAVWLLDEAAAAELQLVQAGASSAGSNGESSSASGAKTGRKKAASTKKATAKGAASKAAKEAKAPKAPRKTKASAKATAEAAAEAAEPKPAAAEPKPAAAEPKPAAAAAPAAAAKDAEPIKPIKPTKPARKEEVAEPTTAAAAATDGAAKKDPHGGQLLPDGSILYTF